MYDSGRILISEAKLKDGSGGTGGTSSISGYSDTFNATTDWTLSGDYYYIDVVHNLNSYNNVIELWDGTTTAVQSFATISMQDINTVRISVLSDPDERFAGRIVIITLLV
jgi:hypothetical protein